MFEQEVRRPVERNGRLARAGTTLHHQEAVQRSADDLVLLGGDGGDDVAHRSGSFAVELGQQGVGDPAGDGRAIRVVEVLFEDVDQIGAGGREAAAHVETQRVVHRRPVERDRDRRPPVDHQGIAEGRPRCGGGRRTSVPGPRRCGRTPRHRLRGRGSPAGGRGATGRPRSPSRWRPTRPRRARPVSEPPWHRPPRALGRGGPARAPVRDGARAPPGSGSSAASSSSVPNVRAVAGGAPPLQRPADRSLATWPAVRCFRDRTIP